MEEFPDLFILPKPPMSNTGSGCLFVTSLIPSKVPSLPIANHAHGTNTTNVQFNVPQFTGGRFISASPPQMWSCAEDKAYSGWQTRADETFEILAPPIS